MPRALLSARVAGSFKSRQSSPFELAAAPRLTPTCPSMPEGARPALACPLGVTLSSLWSRQTFTRQVSAGASLPELLQGWQKGLSGDTPPGAGKL